ncbi:hypothetical protein [Actinomadura violacea]|uniref:Uncharacterized protein n=1 Tax=Actinomadura violacea TaxID=2819934 RepID=A0ABS3S2Q1_9ACTN|nr:hypothetical protein [Actinomadura violacea]MBO2462833.1 hypothetical protein [Actinomadura violacea]
MEPDPTSPATTRRVFLVAGGTAVSAVLVGTAPAGAAEGPAGGDGAALTTDQTAAVLAVARIGAVYPVPFPAYGEPGPAVRRATEPRLRAAAAKLDAARLTPVRTAAEDLVARGAHRKSGAALLADLGAAAADADRRKPLTALTALAVATVSRRFDPGSDEAADAWLGMLARLHRNGIRPTVQG